MKTSQPPTALASAKSKMPPQAAVPAAAAHSNGSQAAQPPAARSDPTALVRKIALEEVTAAIENADSPLRVALLDLIRSTVAGISAAEKRDMLSDIGKLINGGRGGGPADA